MFIGFRISNVGNIYVVFTTIQYATLKMNYGIGINFMALQLRMITKKLTNQFLSIAYEIASNYA